MADGLPYALGDIGSESIVDLGIALADLAIGAVSGAVVASGGIGLPHMAVNSVSGLIVAAGGIGNSHLASNAASGLKVSSEYGPVGTGSPAVYGNMVQFGTGTLTAGSAYWIVFGKAFAAAPYTVITNTLSVGAVCVSGTPTAGSAIVIGATAGDTFNWIAAGSGR